MNSIMKKAIVIMTLLTAMSGVALASEDAPTTKICGVTVSVSNVRGAACNTDIGDKAGDYLYEGFEELKSCIMDSNVYLVAYNHKYGSKPVVITWDFDRQFDCNMRD